jgi:hypothetical protein
MNRVKGLIAASLTLAGCAAPQLPTDAVVRDPDAAVQIAMSERGKPHPPGNPEGGVPRDLRLRHWWSEYAKGEWRVWVGDPACPDYGVFINARTGAAHDETECVTVS